MQVFKVQRCFLKSDDFWQLEAFPSKRNMFPTNFITSFTFRWFQITILIYFDGKLVIYIVLSHNLE